MQEQIEVTGILSTKDLSYPSLLTERTDIPQNCLFGQTTSHVFTQPPGTCSRSLPYLCSASLDKLVRKGRTQWFCISKMSFLQEMQLPTPCKAGALKCPCPCLGSCPGMPPPPSEQRATEPQQKPVPNQALHSPRLWRAVWNTAEQHLEPHLQQSLPWELSCTSPSRNNPDGFCYPQELHCQTKADEWPEWHLSFEVSPGKDTPCIMNQRCLKKRHFRLQLTHINYLSGSCSSEPFPCSVPQSPSCHPPWVFQTEKLCRIHIRNTMYYFLLGSCQD